MRLSMNLFRHILLALLCVVGCFSCINNTIPYPVEEIEILSYEGVGFTSKIDLASRTVTLTLDEQTNITAVEVTKAEITPTGKSSRELTGTFDLSSPMEVTLSRYADYVWTIKAEQAIERYFTVVGQIGESEIDVESRTVTAYVAEGSDLRNISISSLKLGPKEVTTMSPAPEEITDFSTVRYIYLQYPALNGEIERWQLYVLETDIKAQISQADAWATCVWLYGAAQENSSVGFRYRKSGDENWTEVENVAYMAGTLSAKVSGLTPNTTYEFIAYSGDDLSPVVTCTTESIIALENAGFENWCKKDGIVYPYAEGSAPFWATGNVGASIVGETLTEGVEDVRPGSQGKLSARLSSKFASVFGVGKFAAGNLYIGNYVRNDGTHGIVHFGRKFSARPTALKGWIKYNRGMIDRITTQPPGVTINAGDPDIGMVYIALGDWDPATYGGTADSPVEIATRRIAETAFDVNSPAVIAYGEMPLTETVGEWTEFTIPLEYRATNRVPTHIIIACAASRYGDYFTGSTQSVMWVDDFELIYE